ncbi:MAG: hypothetical protein ABWY78_06350 [Microvirga sp.]
METEFIKWMTSLGVGGVLAGGMFWVYRKDSLAAQQRIDALTEQIMTTVHDLIAVTQRVQVLMTQNATIANRLSVQLDAYEARERKRRKQDPLEDV